MPPKRKSTTSRSSVPKKLKPHPVVTSGKAALKAHSRGEVLNENQAKQLTAYIQYLKAQAEEYQNIENYLCRKGEKELSEAEIVAEAEELRGNVTRGIKELMKWKRTCETGSATFTFEGICSTPAIMAKFLGLDTPEDAKFKTKRYTYEEFEDTVIHDTLSSNIHFCSLYLTGNVNLYWKNETGEYKFSGKYGQYGTGKAALAATRSSRARA